VDEKAKRLEDLEERLKFFQEIGADFLFKPAPTARPKAAASPAPAAALPAPGLLDLPPARRGLEAIRAEVLACRKCGLAAGRTQAVPGEGDPRAELMFVGEGPGRDEDLQGRPFVGRAGQLLTRIIAAMGFDRSQVFIVNIVKCRPPENRAPHGDEVEACTPYLLEQVGAVRPRVLVALGKTATDYFIPNGKAMGALRGSFGTWHGIPVMPTFHPAYLIRNEGNKSIKKMVWDDMRRVMAFLAGK
jgi:DNA polymerase